MIKPLIKANREDQSFSQILRLSFTMASFIGPFIEDINFTDFPKGKQRGPGWNLMMPNGNKALWHDFRILRVTCKVKWKDQGWGNQQAKLYLWRVDPSDNNKRKGTVVIASYNRSQVNGDGFNTIDAMFHRGDGDTSFWYGNCKDQVWLLYDRGGTGNTIKFDSMSVQVKVQYHKTETLKFYGRPGGIQRGSGRGYSLDMPHGRTTMLSDYTVHRVITRVIWRDQGSGAQQAKLYLWRVGKDNIRKGFIYLCGYDRSKLYGGEGYTIRETITTLDNFQSGQKSFWSGVKGEQIQLKYDRGGDSTKTIEFLSVSVRVVFGKKTTTTVSRL